MLEFAVQTLLSEWTAIFLNPAKRLYIGYLGSACFIALLWLFLLQGKSWASSWRRVFARDTWLSASARADYALLTINAMLFNLITPRLLGQTAVVYVIFEWLHGLFGGRELVNGVATWVVALAFTLTLFVVDDLARYVLHRLLHRVPLLWRFHQVHHSATSLNPLTVLRTHPVESILFMLRGTLVQGVCIALFVFLFADQVSLLTLLGANVFKFTFNALGANLRHSEIPIAYWPWLERIFLSPAQHQIHHSSAVVHYDKNFGVVLACWDVVFGTFHHSEPSRKLHFGLDNNAFSEHKLTTLYFRPLLQTGRWAYHSSSRVVGGLVHSSHRIIRRVLESFSVPQRYSSHNEQNPRFPDVR